MSEPSLASIIEGLSSYLAYEKLSGTQSVEVEREVRQALLEEEAVVVPAKEAATGVKANTVVAVEADTAPVVRVDGMEHEPTLLFLREGELAEAVEMEPFEGEQGALLKKMIEAMEVPLARVCVVQVVVMEGARVWVLAQMRQVYRRRCGHQQQGCRRGKGQGRKKKKKKVRRSRGGKR